MITELEPHPDASDPEPFAGPDHPMRLLTRATAFGEEWSAENAARVSKVFDGLAPQWASPDIDPLKAAPVLDAIDRGRPQLDGRWIELGSGTGSGCRIIDGIVAEHISVDLSEQMLVHAPDGSPKVRADSACLPFPDDVADVVLLINMLLFPGEVDRILRDSGSVVWVNTRGDQTPIHLSANDAAAALPGDWSGVTARAGRGLWAVLGRG